jgi:hypothetical protein
MYVLLLLATIIAILLIRLLVNVGVGISKYKRAQHHNTSRAVYKREVLVPECRAAAIYIRDNQSTSSASSLHVSSNPLLDFIEYNNFDLSSDADSYCGNFN